METTPNYLISMFTNYIFRICLEKLPTHPEYNTLSYLHKEEIKSTLRQIFPKTEELKPKLLEIFKQDFIKLKKELDEQEKIEAERLKQKEAQRCGLSIGLL